MTQLGTLEELPQDYREAMTQAGVAPLWPMMRNVLPHDAPNPVTRPGYWNYDAIRPLLMRAGELTPVEKAERRVLVLSRGRGDAGDRLDLSRAATAAAGRNRARPCPHPFGGADRRRRQGRLHRDRR